MKRNDEADDIEKLDRLDLIVDRGMLAELKGGADKRVAALREGIRKEHLHLELIAERVRKTCWDNIDGQKGQVITGIRQGVNVANFPLVNYDDRKLRKVLMLRRMQLAEEKLVRQEEAANEKGMPTPAAPDARQQAAAVEAALTSQALIHPSGLHRAESAQHIADAGGDDQKFSLSLDSSGIEAVGSLLHDDLELHGTMRKAAQTHFYRHQVRSGVEKLWLMGRDLDRPSRPSDHGDPVQVQQGL